MKSVRIRYNELDLDWIIYTKMDMSVLVPIDFCQYIVQWSPHHEVNIGRCREMHTDQLMLYMDTGVQKTVAREVVGEERVDINLSPSFGYFHKRFVHRSGYKNQKTVLSIRLSPVLPCRQTITLHTTTEIIHISMHDNCLI